MMRKTSIPFYVTSGLAGLMLLLAGCQTASTKPGSSAPSSALNTQPASGSVHYTVDADHSEVEFLVYKAGALAAFGHDHTVEAHEFTGDVYLAPDFKGSIFSLKLPVKKFEVDRPEARAAAAADDTNFASKPSPSDIQGTTEHMLGPDCLDAEKYPDLTLQSVSVMGSESKAEMTVRITLRGTARDLKVPVTVSKDGDELTAGGDFELKQSEFGITPFSAAGGALQVADTLKVHFKIVSRKTS
ncbi:MAG TPA: YceI family protein [Gammaproteobacteria bacterium]|jgi:polyisoprenoid-binding protein YceI